MNFSEFSQFLWISPSEYIDDNKSHFSAIPNHNYLLNLIFNATINPTQHGRYTCYNKGEVNNPAKPTLTFSFSTTHAI